jgi:HKD family nuclease
VIKIKAQAGVKNTKDNCLKTKKSAYKLFCTKTAFTWLTPYSNYTRNLHCINRPYNKNIPPQVQATKFSGSGKGMLDHQDTEIAMEPDQSRPD